MTDKSKRKSAASPSNISMAIEGSEPKLVDGYDREIVTSSNGEKTYDPSSSLVK